MREWNQTELTVYVSSYYDIHTNPIHTQNLCLNKSKEHHIRSARLPIGTYLAEMRTRKVLTVNQTFEILLKWVETRDWEQALYSVIPKRKFNSNGRRRGGAGSSKGAESTDEDERSEGEGEDMDGAEKGTGENEEIKVIDVAALEDDTASPPSCELLDGQTASMEVDKVAEQ